jgi:hypothetical protein
MLSRSFDLKEFFELYPGLIGWVVLDLGMAASQLSQIGYITNSMALVRSPILRAGDTPFSMSN